MDETRAFDGEKIVFADSEGDNLLHDITCLWTLQIAEGVDGEVKVYADQPGFSPISEGVEILKNADKIVFQNGVGFDIFAINIFYPGTIKPEQLIDTLIISRFNNPQAKRHSLADMGEALGFPKGDFHDFSKFSQEMVTYGIRDVQILQRLWTGDKKRKVPSFRRIYEKYRDALDREFYFAYVMGKQMWHGFRFNALRGQELEIEFRQEKLELERELQELFPPITTERYSEKQVDKQTGKPKRLKDHVEVFNPGSRPQIAKRLIDRHSWKPIAKTPGGDAKVDEDVLDGLPYPEAKSIARYMKLGKKLGQLSDGKNAWLKSMVERPNGYYLYGYINTLGTRTGRCSHSKPNMGQVDGDHRMRELFLPDPEHLLVGVDADGLELRMLAHYLFPYDDGVYAEAVHSGKKEDETDVHSMNRKAAGLYLRPSAKTMIYSANYGCGDAKLGAVVCDDAKAAGMPIPKKSLTAIGKELRATLESRVDGLGELVAKCKKMHNKKEALPGLDGRWIPSASAHSALNTLLQGNGSIIMKESQNIFDREVERLQLLDQIGYCVNCHDEFQISAHPDVAEKVKEVGEWSIMRSGEVMGLRCSLVGTGDIGSSWADTH